MKYVFMILIIIISFLTLFFVKGQFKNDSTAKINNVSFKAEIAKTDEQKSTGLAKYKKIDNDFTMVFPFTTSDYYTFWMKDMKFPIDIIYVNKGKIVDIFSDVPSPTNPNAPLPIIRPKEKADTVLEINAGLADKHKFKKGQVVEVKY